MYKRQAHIDGQTNSKDRDIILKKFSDGIIQILCNVDIISEGFDLPTIEVVQLVRPTKSLSLFLQQVGRAMRISEGKSECLILDHAGHFKVHGIAYADREWSLKPRVVNTQFPERVLVASNRGIKFVLPEQALGYELLEVTPEMLNLLKFEELLAEAKSKRYKLISALFKFNEYLEMRNLCITEKYKQYIIKRFAQENVNYKMGLWYYLRCA